MRHRGGIAAAASMPARREALEARVFAEEGEAHGADRTVALLADDDLGDALVLRFRVVDLVAVDEQDDVCVLLDRARSRAGPTSPAACSGRCSSARLSCDSATTGHLSSLASAFSEREISEISVARFSPLRRRLHQLQVVDDHEAELAVLLHHATRARAHFDRVERGRFVDQDGASLSWPSALDELVPVVGPRRPVRSLCWSSRPTEPISRSASCVAPISIENTATGFS